MALTEFGIVIECKKEHSEKADFPIDSTELGIFILSSQGHREKACFPILIIEFGKVTC